MEMKKVIKLPFQGILLMLILVLISNVLLAQQSVFSSGEWYKIGIVKKGVYELDRSFLVSRLGININELDPTTIRIFSNGHGGMLPQANSAFRKPLQENAILVTGESDGSFDEGDKILFFGNDSDLHRYMTDTYELQYEKNLYSDTSFFFLNVGSEQGLRINDAPTVADNDAFEVTYFDDYISYEKDTLSVRNEGRKWFDYQMFSNSDLSYDIDLQITGITADKNISLKGNLLAAALATSSFDLSLNNRLIDHIEIAARPPGDFNSIGREQFIEYSLIPADFHNIENELKINLTYNPAEVLSNGYLDYFLLEFARTPRHTGLATFFRSIESISHPISKFNIETPQGNSNLIVWDISDNTQPISMNITQSTGNVSFTTQTEELKEFVIFDRERNRIPVSAKKIDNQDILGNLSVDGLIVTHPEFLEQANRLADFHRSHDQLNVAVVTTDQIYNEFSSGNQDLTAIRDYAKFIYDNGNGNLKYLLLFGDCSFDYKKRFPVDHNFVPIYQARESLHPIFSYSSDDYFGFFEEDEGEWQESESGDHTLEIGIGRLPAKSKTEARIFVDKIIRYVSGSRGLGTWRNNVYFIADDGDSNIHQRDAERLSNQLERAKSQFNTEKIYLDAFEQISSPNGERSPVTSEKIIEMIEEGALIINYTGHGNTNVWTDERVFNLDDIKKLSNRNRLALFVTATCQFGQYDNPIGNSGGEELLLNPNGGAIGLVTTTRPVFSNTNFVLNRAFYAAAFENNEPDLPLGDILRITKNTSLRGSVNRNFALLGDPMMRLNVPGNKIELEEIRNITNNSDTISALSQIRLTGRVTDLSGIPVSNFNGELIVTVFDKPSTLRTLGDQNSPFDYTVRNTLLFNGKASVTNGTFSLDFIAPKNIAYNFESGKISLYAVNEDESADASGADIAVVVGGSANSVAQDTEPAEIEIFLNDSTFQSGQTVNKDPLLLVKLTDESGINISNRGFGQNLVGILNDTTEINLNRYYTASLNSFQRGWISYPFRELPRGRHQLKIKVWDIHNNLSESTVDFVVSENVDINLSTVYNYPNPLNTNTTFLIEHDREGEELLINLDIYSLEGQVVHSKTYRFDNPDSRIDEIEWDGNNSSGSPLMNGVYIYKIKVQSTLDGATNEIFRRLVISK